MFRTTKATAFVDSSWQSKGFLKLSFLAGTPILEHALEMVSMTPGL
jgi:hypothetical protein